MFSAGFGGAIGLGVVMGFMVILGSFYGGLCWFYGGFDVFVWFLWFHGNLNGFTGEPTQNHPTTTPKTP